MGMGVHVTWLGLSADAGTFSSMGGLVLAVVSLVLGGAIYAVAYVARPVTAGGPALAGAGAGAGGGIFTGGEPLSDQGRLTAGDFSDIFLQNWHEFFRWTNVDRVYLGFWHALRVASRALASVVSMFERFAALMVIVLAAAVLAGVRLYAPGREAWKIARGIPLSGPLAVPALLVTACAIAAAALVLAALAHAKARPLVPMMMLAATATVAGLILINPWLRLGLLELGAFVTVFLVWQTAKARTAKFTYLLIVLLSALSLVAGDLMLDRDQPEWAWALLLTGACIKLAAIPLSFWLLAIADEIPALVLGLIVAVVDMAAFGEIWVSSNSIPDFFLPHPILIGAAAATSFLAALLMLTPRSLKRLLVLSTVEDIGFLLLGVASLSFLGMQGVVFAAATHALAKALLFACLAAPERDGALEGHPTGLAARYPVAAFGFLFGMLAMLGIPPTLGFLGRWRLYETALQFGWPLAAVFIVSSILALIAYVLALTRVWWGPPPSEAPSPHKEPFLLQAVIVTLVAVLLVGGIWPNVLSLLAGGRP